MNLNNIDYKVFPGGEIQVNLENEINDGYIYASIKNSEDLIKLLMVTDAYKRTYNQIPELYLPYIPYARQDRVANNGESLSIKVLADLINSQNYYKVHVLDPHSDVATSLINNIVVTDSTVFAKKVWDSLSNNIQEKAIIVSPDAGALKKTHKIAKAIGYDREVIFCEKQRNTKTGEITGTKVYCDDIYDNTFILFDDICDGGRTFIEIAKVLKSEGAKEVILVVSHGIFSKGLPCIFEYIDKVYSTDSFRTIENYCEIKSLFQYNALNLMQNYDEEDIKRYLKGAI